MEQRIWADTPLSPPPIYFKGNKLEFKVKIQDPKSQEVWFTILRAINNGNFHLKRMNELYSWGICMIMIKMVQTSNPFTLYLFQNVGFLRKLNQLCSNVLTYSQKSKIKKWTLFCYLKRQKKKVDGLYYSSLHQVAWDIM